jgi:hypothetical protein
MATVFDKILKQGANSGKVPAQSAAAKKWYRQTARDYGKVNSARLLKKDASRLTVKPMVGQLYMYYYDAKHKKTLPYFDRFPLVFPFKKVPGGFLGLNLHYLPLVLRAKLMDALYETSNNNNYDETTRLKLNYNMLDGAAKFAPFKPCVKRYLTTQVKSQFMYIYPTEWDIAIWLPTERFQGASKQQVWTDSRKKIG